MKFIIGLVIVVLFGGRNVTHKEVSMPLRQIHIGNWKYCEARNMLKLPGTVLNLLVCYLVFHVAHLEFQEYHSRW